MTTNQIAEIANTRILPIPWDTDIFERLYTESPIDMLRTTNYDVAALLLADLDQPTFITWVKELADEHDCEPIDILRSISRTLNYALLTR